MSRFAAPQPMTSDECLERVVARVGCVDAAGGRVGTLKRIVADYLRVGLLHLGAADPGPPIQPVHVHQLRGAIRRQLAGLLPARDDPPWVDEAPDAGPAGGDPNLSASDLVLLVLHSLTMLGDCAHLGHGYYVAAPTRAVPLPSGGMVAVGCVTGEGLSGALGARWEWAGLSRAVRPEQAAAVDPAMPRQPLRAWADQPAQPLPEWTSSVIRWARARTLGTAGSDPTNYEVYAPALQRSQSQSFRWVPGPSWRPGGHGPFALALCRSRFPPRRYWLATLQSAPDGPRYDREWTVPRRLVRRLMYGLDQAAGRPVWADAGPVSGGPVGEREIRLTSWPAWPEFQLLSALAVDVTPPEGPHLPLRFRVAPQWWPDVREALTGLGIQVREGPVRRTR